MTIVLLRYQFVFCHNLTKGSVSKVSDVNRNYFMALEKYISGHKEHWCIWVIILCRNAALVSGVFSNDSMSTKLLLFVKFLWLKLGLFSLEKLVSYLSIGGASQESAACFKPYKTMQRLLHRIIQLLANLVPTCAPSRRFRELSDRLVQFSFLNP